MQQVLLDEIREVREENKAIRDELMNIKLKLIDIDNKTLKPRLIDKLEVERW